MTYEHYHVPDGLRRLDCEGCLAELVAKFQRELELERDEAVELVDDLCRFVAAEGVEPNVTLEGSS